MARSCRASGGAAAGRRPRPRPSRFGGTTKMTPSSSRVASSTTLIGSVAWRSRISARWLGRLRVQVLRDDDRGRKSGGRLATNRDRASIPPAEEPMTMSWDPFSIRPPRVAATRPVAAGSARRPYCIRPAANRFIRLV